MNDPLVPVAVGACRCPGAPHPDGDVVFLSPTLPLRGGLLAEATMLRVWSNLDTSGRVPTQTEKSLEIEAGLREVYVRYGVREWNFLDEMGPVPVTEATIDARLLADFSLARPVSEKADSLYTPSVLDPLLARLSKSSPTTRTDGLTSPNRHSSAKHPKRSKPSSITTSPTVATEATSA